MTAIATARLPMRSDDRPEAMGPVRAEPIRVGIVSPYSLSLPGGVQGQVLGLARSLRRHGLEVRVLGPCDGPPPELGVTPLGASLPTATSANGSVAPIAPDLACAFRTIRALRNERFDVLHLHEPFVPGPTSTALMAADVPVVATFHAAGSQPLYGRLGPLARWAARHVAAAAAVSQDAADLVRAVLPPDLVVQILWNGVEVDRFRTDPRPSRHRPPALMFVGRHEERKGLAVLLDAFARLDRGRDVTLWVAGSGPQTETLRAATRDDRVVWLGRIDDDEKVARMRSASALVAPALGGESFGIILLEGMAAEVPVIASAIDGYRNVAVDGVNALLVPPGDPAALAGAIERVLERPDLAAALVAGGRARAEEWSMDALAASYEALYRRVLADSQRRPTPTTDRGRGRFLRRSPW